MHMHIVFHKIYMFNFHFAVEAVVVLQMMMMLMVVVMVATMKQAFAAGICGLTVLMHTVSTSDSLNSLR